ncbi:hypothetical protein PPERSA_08307 [Pseudocohnilembus persalinus]|uniref:Uncharacterized protein n=1 Tax=Pseudocohnilembus persalinus TaxID=266149 RepID=A0A0V0QPH6_PSEPJ|nr:hypothetical protein PPERSA_08307 [Pseudocohnilembus persalinus]|eukprot:KRX04092.1 hypothetical protein PPERSA_08307 [Pseudocohnilembus persalinus]
MKLIKLQKLNFQYKQKYYFHNFSIHNFIKIQLKIKIITTIINQSHAYFHQLIRQQIKFQNKIKSNILINTILLLQFNIITKQFYIKPQNQFMKFNIFRKIYIFSTINSIFYDKIS